MLSLAGSLLHAGQRHRGVSQRQLAREAGVSAPGLSDIAHGRKDITVLRLDRLLRHLGYQLTALPTRRATAAGAAHDIREHLASRDEQAALRDVWQLAADLHAVDPATRVALTVAPPVLTGDARFDALLAGVVDHVLSSDRLPVPLWVHESSRAVPTPWDVEPVPALRGRARALTPDGLVRHGVYLDPSELVNL